MYINSNFRTNYGFLRISRSVLNLDITIGLATKTNSCTLSSFCLIKLTFVWSLKEKSTGCWFQKVCPFIKLIFSKILSNLLPGFLIWALTHNSFENTDCKKLLYTANFTMGARNFNWKKNKSSLSFYWNGKQISNKEDVTF